MQFPCLRRCLGFISRRKRRSTSRRDTGYSMILPHTTVIFVPEMDPVAVECNQSDNNVNNHTSSHWSPNSSSNKWLSRPSFYQPRPTLSEDARFLHQFLADEREKQRTIPTHDASRAAILETARVSLTAIDEQRQAGDNSFTNSFLSKKDEKKMRKAVNRAVRHDEKWYQKQQRKIERLIKRHEKLGMKENTETKISRTNSIRRTISRISRRQSDSEDVPERMDFLFFSGCPENSFSYEQNVSRRKNKTNKSRARQTQQQSPATPMSSTSFIRIKPTLVRNMPPVFAPTLGYFV